MRSRASGHRIISIGIAASSRVLSDVWLFPETTAGDVLAKYGLDRFILQGPRGEILDPHARLRCRDGGRLRAVLARLGRRGCL